MMCTKCAPSSAFARSVAARGTGRWYVAWFEPEHHIVERNASFFVDRFAGMRWSILTPDRCAHWDGKHLTFTAGVPKAEAPTDDNMEELWRQLLRAHFQSRAGEDEGDAGRDAEALLEESSRGPSHPRADSRSAAPGRKMIARSEAKHPPASDWQPASPPRRRAIGETARSGLRLPRVSALARRHPDGFWRRAAPSGDHAARRATGRLGRPRRPALRRSGRDSCSTALSPRPASIGRRFTSPTRSNISNGSRAANGACTKAEQPRHRRLPSVAGSRTRGSPTPDPRLPRRHRRESAAGQCACASSAIAARFSNPISASKRSSPCTPLHSCVRPTKPPEPQPTKSSSATSAPSPG